ncbi:MAG: alpha-glucan family phosphorylase, partial [Pirellulaceae bacterium]|nr:alpha-glucan family phosphorylase [Pirellulaceae bacterium]
NLQRHLTAPDWVSRRQKSSSEFTVAYFCAEFGLTECLQIYSGGLGCLAGDHLKSAAELGLPLVGVGLLYRHGYFQQYLNADGWQQEYYPDLDFANLPISPALDTDGHQKQVAVDLAGRQVHVAVWTVRVGRVELYLLDTNVPENDPADRSITGQLYGGDMEMRIKQEIVLGIGGVHALSELGIEPDICHMNEGHSAFLSLERVRRLIERYDLSFDEARHQAAAANVFTTHTPVPAGIDRFPPELVQHYFKDYQAQLRLDVEGFLALGRENVSAKNEFFSMAVLAIRMSNWANGVSRLHGSISRSMWHTIWPGVPEEDVPVGHVTNGVHARSWMSGDLINLLDRYLGAARWQNDPADQTVWQSINDVADDELWRIHELRRNRLVLWTRRRLYAQLESHGAGPEQVREAGEALDPGALTIGFARRFATYKRATLILRDPQRLLAMLSNSERPVQVIIAGKAHPADAAGKELIRQIVQTGRSLEGNLRIVFIENYDINVARYLVQGCDLWLNTPRRGLEASGTSGMKAAFNGVLNCSALDGWWDEAYRRDLGWAIGRGEIYSNHDVQDEVESKALYDLLEQQIIPLFYDRDEQDVPRQWVARMKQCISTLAPEFNANRMVQEYAEKYYMPAFHRAAVLKANNLEKAVALAHQKDRLKRLWKTLRIDDVEADTHKPLGMQQRLNVKVIAALGALQPDEVRLQVYVGRLDNDGRINDGSAFDLKHSESIGDGRHRFHGAIETRCSGRNGFAVRIVPGGELIDGITEPGLILWDRRSEPRQSAAPSIEPVFAQGEH